MACERAAAAAHLTLAGFSPPPPPICWQTFRPPCWPCSRACQIMAAAAAAATAYAARHQLIGANHPSLSKSRLAVVVVAMLLWRLNEKSHKLEWPLELGNLRLLNSVRLVQISMRKSGKSMNRGSSNSSSWDSHESNGINTTG